jgi:hypothetical protein
MKTNTNHEIITAAPTTNIRAHDSFYMCAAVSKSLWYRCASICCWRRVSSSSMIRFASSLCPALRATYIHGHMCGQIYCYTYAQEHYFLPAQLC